MSDKYSVESLHVYSDECFNEEHVLGTKAMQRVLQKLSVNYDSIILVDNYNPTYKDFDLSTFMQNAREHGITIDYVAYEADLAQYYQDVLDMMPNNKFKRRYEQYVKKRQKIPCSFLTAIWYLLRLGILPQRGNIIIPYIDRSFLPANRLINILPKRFSPTEEKAHAIIRHTPHAAVLNNIETVYHNSPKLHHPSLSSVELSPLAFDIE